MDISQFIFKASDLSAMTGKIVTIFGDAGVGKTTIAHACFPKPLFIPIERGLLSVPNAQSIQQPTTTGELLAFLGGIEAAKTAGNFPYQTIILDSVSELETLASREICAAKSVKTIGDIKGFGGGGYALVGAVHREVREACDNLILLGLNVVFIAHAVSKTETFPDVEPYSRWILQVGKAGSTQYLNQVDAAIHVKNAVSITTVGANEAKLAKTIKNQRILDMVSKPSTVAKNRFGISQDIIFNYSPDSSEFNNPLASILGFDS